MKGKQIAFIVGAIALTVLLYFTNKIGKPTEVAVEKTVSTAINLATYADSVIHTLPKNEQALISKLQTQGEEISKSDVNDSISKLLLPKSITAAAFYALRKAEILSNKDTWKTTGKLFFKATRFEKPYLKKTLFENAIHCFDEAIKIDSTDLETKTLLGTCYVEGSSNPMTGIMMLREVVTIDSSYIDAQVQLGLFAIQSGQLDKAIDRFNKILKIKPTYIEAYIYLGQINADMGNKTEAIKMLEMYQQKSNDKIINQQVEQFINELKISLKK